MICSRTGRNEYDESNTLRSMKFLECCRASRHHHGMDVEKNILERQIPIETASTYETEHAQKMQYAEIASRRLPRQHQHSNKYMEMHFFFCRDTRAVYLHFIEKSSWSKKYLMPWNHLIILCPLLHPSKHPHNSLIIRLIKIS